MLSLLKLPRELRDAIYVHVLEDVSCAPSFDLIRERRKQLMSYGSGSIVGCNIYPIGPPPVSGLGLLLTSRQVYEEMNEAIADLKRRKGICYKLDCVIEDEQRLYPTWLAIPTLSEDVDKVAVDFRLAGDRRNRPSGFSYRDCAEGGPGEITWNLIALLHRFLDRGPDFLSAPKQRRKIRVGYLELNVVTPREREADFIPTTFDVSCRVAGLIHPETVVCELEARLDILCNIENNTSGFRKYVCERVGLITLALDGRKRRFWNLADIDWWKGI
ncbi:hypothetical protein H2201_001155 [Coniosporium apollinis]|uniref:F-box domain-containing protein n=2 Tax=Coniosporium TaxID=2810619 RepID=A0ABQ9P1P5_9PEZI|nr:hypothetical protein H2199_001568 [Cladosporium sp. JES 115]KAJ9668514.1 hypothetical protein H2201_001155 [Coniosporium apollinis]